MYKRNRVHIEVPRQGLPPWIALAIKVSWIIGILGALTLAINIVKEAI